ncbi:MAG: hypothetical protein KKD18_03010, partial [Nanoarchaeota archaeon]|nr:hypothetical protein [Nanoarchaeota archaeon]
MKILHISTDNTFIGQAIQTFENVYPGQNVVWMLRTDKKLKFSSNLQSIPFRFVETLNPFFSQRLRKYDLVILHSFNVFWFMIVAFAPKKVRFAWLGWGYDYYDYIYKTPDELLLMETKALSLECASTVKNSAKAIAKKAVLIFLNRVIKSVLIKKIHSFSPV